MDWSYWDQEDKWKWFWDRCLKWGEYTGEEKIFRLVILGLEGFFRLVLDRGYLDMV